MYQRTTPFSILAWVGAILLLGWLPIRTPAAENACTPPWCAVMNLQSARLNFYQGESDLGLSALDAAKVALAQTATEVSENQSALNQIMTQLRDTPVISLQQLEWTLLVLKTQITTADFMHSQPAAGWWAWLLNTVGLTTTPIINLAQSSALVMQWQADLERLRQFAWFGNQAQFQQAAAVIEKRLTAWINLPRRSFWLNWSRYLQHIPLRQDLTQLDALITALARPVATDTAATAITAAEEIPDRVCTGIYLMSLHEINIPNNTFSADFWIWSIVNKPNLQPLKTLEVINARAPQISLYSDQPLGEQHWAQEKISGVFRHQWDETNFPFERNTLSIIIEEAQADTRKLVYEADKAGSSYSKDIRIDGYAIIGMSIESKERHYDTGFGDPTAPASSYAQLRINIELGRNSIVVFFKLHAALYAAFLVTAFCFLLLPNIPTIMTSINSAIVGALFASVINLRAADAVIGRSESVTLVDRLHFVSFAHFIVLWGIAVWVLMTRKDWDDTALKRFSRKGLLFYMLVYITANGLLIWRAATA